MPDRFSDTVNQMQPPFQIIAAATESNLLLVASGSSLFAVSLGDGTIVSRWKPQGSVSVSDDSRHKPDENGNEPPSKKRKVKPVQELPNIIFILITADEKHVVIVTGEDKCLRIVELTPDSQMSQVSQRHMTKRPCAVTLSPDGSTVFCADKFGDVYSVPLLSTPEQDQAARDDAKAKTKFTPSASELTVHSQANLKTLKNQIKQASEAKLLGKTKEPLSFAHELVLGHVSMLTDIIIAETHDHGRRQFIITADRDEHIRISRGPPQAYVIERFCLGHKDFISKLCLVGNDILISGGGDDDIYVWNWKSGKLLRTIHLREHVSQVRQTQSKEVDAPNVAVTGLWSFSSTSTSLSNVLIACEGVPAVFHFDCSSLLNTSPITIQPLILPGNVLDLAMIGDNIIVSVDTVHQPGTINVVDESTGHKPRLLAFGIDSSGIKPSENSTHKLVEINQVTATEWHEKQLQALLYSTESLRKRRSQEGDDAGANEQSIDEEP